MTAKHTNGKWRQFNHDNSVMVINENQYVIAEIYPDSKSEVMEANARLIAASPTMYDYIKKQADNGCQEAQSMIDLLK